MSHIKRSPSDPENEDNAMEWEEDKGIERLDACVEDETSLVDTHVAPEYAYNQNINSVYTGQKRKSSFSSPMPAKISRNIWCGEPKEGHPSVNEASPCNDSEVTSEFSTTPPASQMMIVDSLDNSCQATNGNTSAVLANDDTNYSKGDISTDSVPENGAVSYPNRAILNFPDHDVVKEKITHLLDTEGLLLDSEGSSPDREDPSAKTKGSPPDTERTSPDTERTSPDTERTSPDTERTSPDTERTSPDTEGSSPDTARTLSEESSLTERTLSDVEGSSSEIEGSSPHTPCKIERTSSDEEGSSTDTEDPLSKTKGSPSGTKGSSPDTEGSLPDTVGSSPDNVGSSPEKDRELSDAERILSDTEGSSPDTEGSSPDTEDPTPNREVISLRHIPPGFADLSNRSLDILRNHLKSHNKQKSDDIYKYFDYLPPINDLGCKICEMYASEPSPPISPREPPSPTY